MDELTEYPVTLTAQQWSAVQACLAHAIPGIQGTSLGNRAQSAMDAIDAGFTAAIRAQVDARLAASA